MEKLTKSPHFSIAIDSSDSPANIGLHISFTPLSLMFEALLLFLFAAAIREAILAWKEITKTGDTSNSK